MRIVFMGTPDFAVPSLQALLDAGHEVCAVYTQPDKPKGRGYVLTPPPVKELALARGIPVLQPATLRTAEALESLRAFHPDAIVVVAYGKLLPPDVLAVPPLGCVNVHGSLLPKYRGGAPIQYAVMNGDSETGVSIMYMVKQMDAGDVLAQRRVPITAEDDAGTMFAKLSLVGRDLLMETLPKLVAGEVEATPQDESQVVFSPNISTAQERIDYRLPARLIDAKVRGLRPKPLANLVLDGVVTKLLDVTPLAEKTALAPGQVVRVEKHGLILAAGEGTTYRINRLKPAGKPAMEITAYLNGHQDLAAGKQAVTDD